MTEDLTPKTPREVRMCRVAFLAGAQWADASAQVTQSSATLAAIGNYPMPMIETPRVVSESFDGGVSYMIDKSAGLPTLMVRAGWTGGQWMTFHAAPHTVAGERLAMIADVIANPVARKPADEV